MHELTRPQLNLSSANCPFIVQLKKKKEKKKRLVGKS
jgi:hypothetical protein